MINLDNNATTQPTPAVVDAVAEALTRWWANPSSVHRAGQDARRQLELARQDLADLIGARPRELIFTSGGTESLDLAIRGILAALPRRDTPPRIVTSRLEHAAVRDLVEDLEKNGLCSVSWAPATREGLLRAEDVAPLAKGAALVVAQWVNNETGAIQPVHELSCVARQAGSAFLVDATQAVGKIAVSVLGPSGDPLCDALVFSPHKFHGPKGVGVLWTRPGLKLRPRIHGTQELGRRGGTENVPCILGAAAAAREALAWLKDPSAAARSVSLRDRFEQRILAAIPSAVVNGPRDPALRLWNTTNIGFPPLEAEVVLLYLSERGLAASAGAACSSGSLDPSPVLLAMGVPEPVAHGSLRFSLSRFTTEQEIDAAADIVIDAARSLAT